MPTLILNYDELLFESRRQASSFSDVKGRVAIANPQPRNVSGVKPEPPNPFGHEGHRVGRFGWRGQIASLREFVLGACANELGLEVSTNSQATNPLGRSYRAPGVDLTTEQCEALVSFVASLPRPLQIKPDDPDQAALVDLGENRFREIGCANCHTQTLGDVAGLYSDLLLHDMGSHLADLVPVNSSNPSTSHLRGGGYNGGSLELFTLAPIADRQAWRTPPLWGVRDSGPYMHDGRAGTLREAIVLHGGEARSARVAFLRLSMSQQSNVVAFLQTLAAPVSANGNE